MIWFVPAAWSPVAAPCELWQSSQSTWRLAPEKFVGDVRTSVASCRMVAVELSSGCRYVLANTVARFLAATAVLPWHWKQTSRWFTAFSSRCACGAEWGRWHASQPLSATVV